MADRPPLEPVDPVIARRTRLGDLARRGQRLGYVLFGAAIVAFALGAIQGFTTPVVTIVVASLALGSVILAPAIILSYGVRAAARDDADR